MENKDIKPSELNNIIEFAGVLKTVDIYLNDGQIHGVPKNPRYGDEEKMEKLKNSLREDPEYLNVRPLIVYPYAAAYVVLMGNMRLKCCIDLGILEVPCIVLNRNLPPEKLVAYMMKDNVSFGNWDFEQLANEFDAELLDHWGIDIPNFDIESPEDETDTPDSLPSIEIIFNGLSVDKFDEVKDKIFKITSKYQGVELKA